MTLVATSVPMATCGDPRNCILSAAESSCRFGVPGRGLESAPHPGLAMGFRNVSQRHISMILYGVLWISLVGHMLYVGTLAPDFPDADSFDYLEQLTGRLPITPSWLWSQHNEHRVWLPRVISLVAIGLTRDFRAVACLNVLLLTATAWLALRVVRRLRGRHELTDLVFPLLWMGSGYATESLMQFNLQLVLHGFAVGLFVFAGAHWTAMRPVARALLVGSAAAVLALVGMHGLAVLPFIAFFAAGVAWQRFREGRYPWAFAHAVFAVLVGLWPLIYFAGYEQQAQHPEAPTALAVLGAIIDFGSVSLGCAGRWTRPILPTLILVVATAMALFGVGRIRRTDGDRPANWTLVTAIGSTLGLAIAAGILRSALGPDVGLAPRYAAIAHWLVAGTVLLCCRLPQRSARTTVFLSHAVVTACVIYNARTAWVEGVAYRDYVRTVESAVWQGMTPPAIAARFYQTHRVTTMGLQGMSEANLGPYALAHAARPAMLQERFRDIGQHLGSEPYWLTSPQLVETTTCASGREGILLHAPGALYFHVPELSREVDLGFGACPVNEEQRSQVSITLRGRLHRGQRSQELLNESFLADGTVAEQRVALGGDLSRAVLTIETEAEGDGDLAGAFLIHLRFRPPTRAAVDLSERKHPGYPWEGRGTVKLDDDGLFVAFAAVRPAAGPASQRRATPVRAETVDLSVDGNDRYRVTFYRHARVVGTVNIVPTNEVGLAVHRLALPPAARGGITHAHIVPIDGDGFYSVGHFILD